MQELIVVFGLPGVGKSSIAELLAKKKKAVLLKTDEIRREHIQELGHPLIVENIYPENAMQRVYNIMFNLAAEKLKEGETVILDGTFAKRKNRNLARKIAKSARIPFRFVYIICDAGNEFKSNAIIRARMSQRLGENASTAQFHHYLKYKYGIFEYPLRQEIDVVFNNIKEEVSPVSIEKIISASAF